MGEKPVIDLKKPNRFLYFGTSVQKSVGKHVDELVSLIRENKSTESEKGLTRLIGRIKEMDFSAIAHQPRGTRFFRWFHNSDEKKWEQYEELIESINREADEMNRMKYKLQRDVIFLQKLKETNQELSIQLSLYMQAIQDSLPHLREQIHAGDSAEVLGNRLYALQVSQTILTQTLMQIEQVERISRTMAEKIQEAVSHAVPLFNTLVAQTLQQGRKQTSQKESEVRSVYLNELRDKQRELIGTLTRIQDMEQEKKTTLQKSEHGLGNFQNGTN